MFANEHCYFFRKPTGLASTRGKEACFLDSFTKPELKTAWSINDFPHMVDIFQQMNAIHGVHVDNEAQTRAELGEIFSRDEEYGLLNRLDTATSGLLYFARSREVYEQYRARQRTGMIQKYYLAQVWWEVGRNVEKLKVEGWKIVAADSIRHKIEHWTPQYVETHDDGFVLRFPIMHHRHDAERMSSVQTPAGLDQLARRGRGNILTPETLVSVVSYDREENTSIVRVMIRQGVRHQIRVHLATLGNPILGDVLYGNAEAWYASLLQLVSAGCTIKQ
jgi:23S rRNA-/tRNA-specific pseudouridylate synthase